MAGAARGAKKGRRLGPRAPSDPLPLIAHPDDDGLLPLGEGRLEQPRRQLVAPPAAPPEARVVSRGVRRAGARGARRASPRRGFARSPHRRRQLLAERPWALMSWAIAVHDLVPIRPAIRSSRLSSCGGKHAGCVRRDGAMPRAGPRREGIYGTHNIVLRVSHPPSRRCHAGPRGTLAPSIPTLPPRHLLSPGATPRAAIRLHRPPGGSPGPELGERLCRARRLGTKERMHARKHADGAQEGRK
jgi:hypothetical protein